MEPSFTDAEKRFVLAEMIKVSHMDVAILVDFVKYHDIRPNWMDMQLPGGRNMNQCLRATETMFSLRLSPPVMPMLKRKSFGDINEQTPKRQAVVSSMEPQTYLSPRGFGSHSASANQPLNIQPRPSSNGYPAASPTTSAFSSTPTSAAQPVPAVPPTTVPSRKRGRPSKADKEALARANALQSGGYAPITPALIAPFPAPTTAPQSHSPSRPAAVSVYHSSTGSISEPKGKKMAWVAVDAGSQHHQQAETVPRSTQQATALESADQQAARAGHGYGWPGSAARHEDQQKARVHGPVTLEPPIQPQRQTLHPTIGGPNTSLPTPGLHKTGVGGPPRMEHA